MYTLQQAYDEIVRYKKFSNKITNRNKEEIDNTSQKALDAYKAITNEINNNCDYGETLSIIINLMNSFPLSPIIDEEGIWKLTSTNYGNVKESYKCTRLSSLFKTIYKDNTVKYSDINRFRFYDIHGVSPHIPFHSSFVSYLFDNMFPIKFPYSPEVYNIYGDHFLTDERNGDFDTIAIYSYNIEGSGKHDTEINRYYKSDENIDEDFVEITKSEFDKRVKMHLERIKNK